MQDDLYAFPWAVRCWAQMTTAFARSLHARFTDMEGNGAHGRGNDGTQELMSFMVVPSIWPPYVRIKAQQLIALMFSGRRPSRFKQLQGRFWGLFQQRL